MTRRSATADLSSLRAAFSRRRHAAAPGQGALRGSSSRERGGRVELLEGYGLTETVTAIMCIPLGEYREGSIGVPFPDTLADDLPPATGSKSSRPGEEGEICLSGPAVMIGYLDNPEATAEALQRARRRPHLAAHRRPRPHGRGRLLLLPRAAEADDQVVGLQRLSGRGRDRARAAPRRRRAPA